MLYENSAWTPVRRHRARVYARRRAALCAPLLLLLIWAFVAIGRGGSAHAGRAPGGALPGGARSGGGLRLAAVSWPAQGQAALAIGRGRPAASPGQRPAPVASLAKVMTAYLTLEHYPLSGSGTGFTVTVTSAQAAAEADDDADGESVVAVQPGEQLTERQLLEALLIPSGNNIAEILADTVAGGEPQFVAAMNDEARSLGMGETTYTDPSGFDEGTASTAADQLRVLQAAMRFPAFRQIASMSSVTLPVAGTLQNFNPLIANGYGGKTGSDSAAGGCLAFFTRVMAGGRPRRVAGVVMGQGAGSNTAAILGAAGDAARQLVASVSPSS